VKKTLSKFLNSDFTIMAYQTHSTTSTILGSLSRDSESLTIGGTLPIKMFIQGHVLMNNLISTMAFRLLLQEKNKDQAGLLNYPCLISLLSNFSFSLVETLARSQPPPTMHAGRNKRKCPKRNLTFPVYLSIESLV
jgi:hypothetical protein